MRIHRASALQAFDFFSLDGLDKIAVFLNVFHAMVLHGMLILGPPASWSSWPSFFNFFSYIISYDFVCISEFEHNILRYSNNISHRYINIFYFFIFLF